MYKLEKCIKNKRVNYSQTRELIYKILENSSECLSVQEIVDLANEEYPKRIPINTVYRHLRFFIECELAFSIQDDLKKAYYCLCKDEATIVMVCSECNSIKKTDIKVCDELKNSDFITIHKKCESCS